MTILLAILCAAAAWACALFLAAVFWGLIDRIRAHHAASDLDAELFALLYLEGKE